MYLVLNCSNFFQCTCTYYSRRADAFVCFDQIGTMSSHGFQDTVILLVFNTLSVLGSVTISALPISKGRNRDRFYKNKNG